MIWYSKYACSMALDIEWHIRKIGLMLCTYNVVRRSITVINFNVLFVIHSIDQINSSSFIYLYLQTTNTSMIICTHSYSQDPMLAFASPGSEVRIRMPRVRCALSHSRVRCDGDHRLVPCPSLRGSQWQPRWGGASRDGRGAFGWRSMRLWKPVSGNPPSVNTPDDHWPGPRLAI